MRVRNFRATEEEFARYVKAASGEGFSAWARQRLNEAAELDLVEADELARKRREREELRVALRGGDAA